MSDSVAVTTLTIGITLMAPILWAALGEVIIEQAGVLNIGIEGVMIIGAFAAAAGFRYTDQLWIGLLTGLGSGVVCGIALAILYVRLGADQIVAGILFNLFAFGLTTTLFVSFLGGGVASTFPKLAIPGLHELPVLGDIFFNHNFMVYGAFLAAPVVFYLIRRTWFGLYARACAEKPRAVESAGLDVWTLQYAAVVTGCVLTAAGGAMLVLQTSGGFVPGITAGRGFIALAVVVLARWNPFGVIAACILFGVAQALQFQIQNLGPFSHIPTDFVLMLPYVVTILAVVFARGSRYPAATGVPYRPAASDVH